VSTNQDSDLQSLVAWSDAVLETAVDAIVSITSTGTIHRVNPATLKMFGYSRDELIGRNVSMLMPQPHRSEHDGHLRRYLETGIAGIIGIGRRVTACRSDGSEFPVHLAVSEFSLNGKRMFNGIVRDLTELEQVHQQLLQSERLVAIGEMMTGLAHESRNALQRAQACRWILLNSLSSWIWPVVQLVLCRICIVSMKKYAVTLHQFTWKFVPVISL
jgi:PAS domain S-box-containing protein